MDNRRMDRVETGDKLVHALDSIGVRYHVVTNSAGTKRYILVDVEQNRNNRYLRDAF